MKNITLKIIIYNLESPKKTQINFYKQLYIKKLRKETAKIKKVFFLWNSLEIKIVTEANHTR